jgi:hypothetical protein
VPKRLYSDVVIILCHSSFIPVLYGFVPLETRIARDSLFLGLSQRCRESGFRSRKFSSFQFWWTITWLWSAHEVFLLSPKSCLKPWSESEDQELVLEELTGVVHPELPRLDRSDRC